MMLMSMWLKKKWDGREEEEEKYYKLECASKNAQPAKKYNYKPKTLYTRKKGPKRKREEKCRK